MFATPSIRRFKVDCANVVTKVLRASAIKMINVDTNTVDGFWSLIKRSVIGTFHHVSRKYLQLYVAEFQFRYNNRNKPDVFGSAIRAC